jgi:predicted ATPase
MATHTATVRWSASPAEDYAKGQYSRAHEWLFDGGAAVRASASPHIVPAPWSDAAGVDPEEAFVASLSSCHMLFFLDGDSVEAERAHFRPELAGELVRLVDPGGDRRDPVPGKTLGRLADRVRHFAKLKIQAHICHRGLLTNGRVAPANGFEQATAQSYVQCNRNPPSP